MISESSSNEGDESAVDQHGKEQSALEEYAARCLQNNKYETKASLEKKWHRIFQTPLERHTALLLRLSLRDVVLRLNEVLRNPAGRRANSIHN
jgi:hypothetical protein